MSGREGCGGLCSRAQGHEHDSDEGLTQSGATWGRSEEEEVREEAGKEKTEMEGRIQIMDDRKAA